MRIAGLLLVWLAALAVVAATLLLGVMAWLSYREDEMSPRCDIDVEEYLEERVGKEVSLLDLAPDDADEVRIYAEYASLDDLRQSGLEYDPPFDHVPESAYVVAYFESRQLVCATLAWSSGSYHLEPADREPDGSPNRYRVVPGPWIEEAESDELVEAIERADPALRELTLGSLDTTRLRRAKLARAECLKYEPAVVTIEGTLVKRAFPGPPSYESVAAGDRAEEALLIVLAEPVCVDGDPSSELNPESESDLLEVQVVPHGGLDEKLLDLVGQRVSAIGTLFHSHTGHHRTAVLIWPNRIRGVDAAR